MITTGDIMDEIIMIFKEKSWGISPFSSFGSTPATFWYYYIFACFMIRTEDNMDEIILFFEEKSWGFSPFSIPVDQSRQPSVTNIFLLVLWYERGVLWTKC